MPHWAEGLLMVYAMAVLALGVLFAFLTDLPWWVKLGSAVFWPVTLGAIAWSVLEARTRG